MNSYRIHLGGLDALEVGVEVGVVAPFPSVVPARRKGHPPPREVVHGGRQAAGPILGVFRLRFD